MASLTLAGRDYSIAPYKLGSLRKAAPFIDRINATAGSMETLEAMTDATADFLAVLSIGLVKIEPKLTADALEEMVGFDDLPALKDAFQEVLRESGLVAGEAKAPSRKGRAGASKQTSEPSSTD